MEIIFTGLLLGLMGSFHCVGMCGPIALALPLRGNSFLEKAFGGILYNLGRTVTYGLMGAVFGLLGQGLEMMGFQRWISVIMGSVMILSVLFPALFKNMGFESGIFSFVGSLKKKLQKLFAVKSYGGLFSIGVLNGLLPCGLVYMAIAGALGTGDITFSTLFMVLFGLGTLPILLVISLAGNVITTKARTKLTKIVPFVIVFVGIIFVLRGLSLGIPFLSPPEEKIKQKFEQKLENVQTKDSILSGETPPCCK